MCRYSNTFYIYLRISQNILGCLIQLFLNDLLLLALSQNISSKKNFREGEGVGGIKNNLELLIFLCRFCYDLVYLCDMLFGLWVFNATFDSIILIYILEVSFIYRGDLQGTIRKTFSHKIV